MRAVQIILKKRNIERDNKLFTNPFLVVIFPYLKEVAKRKKRTVFEFHSGRWASGIWEVTYRLVVYAVFLLNPLEAALEGKEAEDILSTFSQIPNSWYFGKDFP